MVDDTYYTVKDLMERLSLGRNKVLRLCQSESFPAVKIGKTYRVSAKQLENWFEQYAGTEFYF